MHESGLGNWRFRVVEISIFGGVPGVQAGTQNRPQGVTGDTS